MSVNKIHFEKSLREFSNVEGGRIVSQIKSDLSHFFLWVDTDLKLQEEKIIFGSEDQGYIKLNVFSDKIELETDSIGLGLFYYIEHDWGISICTEYEPLIHTLRKIELDEEGVFQFLKEGMTLNNKTLIKSLEMSKPGTKLEIYTNGRYVWNFSPYIVIEKSLSLQQAADEAYSIVWHNVKKLVHNEFIKLFALTAGADTRLILSCLSSDELKSLNFWFDDRYASTNLKISHEKKIVQNLVSEYNLKMDYGLPASCFGRSSNRSKKNRLRSFEGDFRLNTCSGMFGGEILGGALFEEMGLEANNYNVQFAFRQLFCSFMGTTHDDVLWRHPHYFFYTRNTPFLSIKLIKLMLSLPTEYYLYYRMYRLIYETHAAKFINIPFYSPITSYGPPFMQLESNIKIETAGEALYESKSDLDQHEISRYFDEKINSSLVNEIENKENFIKRKKYILTFLQDSIFS